MNRPDPDQLLKHISAEEAASGRGRLKLFFGASPGVGKTFAMLEAARQRQKEGWDVVVGVVETHKRAETEALVQGLEVLPRRDIAYKGVTLAEFDLDAALVRRPRLLLVDELAHTNAPGLRHAKRWQDVEELLDAGIDVYTTLNVQHWETLNDVVAQITGVIVRETVPDTFLRRAHELELVDLAPEDLLTRLKEGKVYHGELAGRATENFFKPGNLIALRELALRHAAERVDAQMQAFRERHAITEAWSVGEKLLVGVTGSPMSARLIRAAGRLAGRLHAPWVALHVETPHSLQSPEARARTVDHLRFAERLGAETVTISGQDVTAEMLAYAKSHHVTRIVLGKPARSRWREWLFGSVVNEVARHCGAIDLHVISGVGAELASRRPLERAEKADWTDIGWGILTAFLSTAVCWPLASHFDRVNLVMIYLLSVVWAAYRFGSRAALAACVAGVLAFDFFYVPPHLTFAVSDTQYLFTFTIMLSVGILISTLTGRLRLQTEASRRREDRMRVLYQLSRALSETPDPHELLQAAHRRLQEFYKQPLLLLTASPQGELEIAAGDAEPFEWSQSEASVARWALDHSQMAGCGTDTLAGSKGLYVPLKGIRSTVGILALRASADFFADPEQLQLAETFAGEIGGALESTRMSEAMGRAEVQAEIQALGHGAAVTPTSSLTLGERLRAEQIVFLSAGLADEAIVRELIARLKLPNPRAAFEAIMEREKAGATAIGDAVLIPHARLAGLKTLEVAMGIDAVKGCLYVLFVSPADQPQAHLAFLASLSRNFQNPQLAQILLAAHSADEVCKALHYS